MKIEILNVATLDDAVALLQKALDNGFDDSKSYEIAFGDWLQFCFKVEGDKYQSTLPASSLKALAQYQAAINSFYAALVYSKTTQSLTDDDKKDLELIFHFSQGSSVTKAGLGDVVERLGLRAIEKMNGNQLVVTVLGLALLAGAYAGHSNYLDAETAQHQTEAHLQVVQAAIDANSRLSSLNADIAASAVNMAKSVIDADAIEIGRLSLSADEIPDYIKRERTRRQHSRIDGLYRVTRIAETDSGFRISLEDEDGVAVPASMPMDGSASSQILSELFRSLESKQAVPLHVVAKMRSGVPVEASILTGHIQDTLLHGFADND